MPRATSRAMDPVGMTSMGTRTSAPSRITAPLPCAFSICAITAYSDFARSAPAISLTCHFCIGVRRLPATDTYAGMHLVSSQTLRATTDNHIHQAQTCGRWDDRGNPWGQPTRTDVRQWVLGVRHAEDVRDISEVHRTRGAQDKRRAGHDAQN